MIVANYTFSYDFSIIRSVVQTTTLVCKTYGITPKLLPCHHPREIPIPGFQHLQTQTTTCNLLYIQPSHRTPISIPLQQLLFLVTPRQTLNLNINQLPWQDNYMHYGTVQQTATTVLAAGDSCVKKYTNTPMKAPHTRVTHKSCTLCCCLSDMAWMGQSEPKITLEKAV